jgi:hypothetical protein
MSERELHWRIGKVQAGKQHFPAIRNSGLQMADRFADLPRNHLF